MSRQTEALQHARAAVVEILGQGSGEHDGWSSGDGATGEGGARKRCRNVA